MNPRSVLKLKPFLLGVLAIAALTVVALGVTGLTMSDNHKSSIPRNRNQTSLPRGTREPLGSHPTGGEPGEIDWTQPFVDTNKVSGVAAAATVAGFAPVVPQALGSPAAVAVHGSYRPQAVGLVFNTPAFGRFIVLEDRAQPNEQEFLENLAATCHPQTGCEGSWTMISLKNGIRALLIANPDVSNGVLWVENGLSFDAFGPSDTFSVADAEAVAGELVVAGAS